LCYVEEDVHDKEKKENSEINDDKNMLQPAKLRLLKNVTKDFGSDSALK
jgi:hypothetical protein